MMQMMQGALEAANREISELRKATLVRPPEDPFKTELLSSLMREDNARLSSVRSQFESEIRILKENAVSEQRRLEDRHERYQADAARSHDRELQNLRQSHEISLQAARASFETQVKLLDMEQRRLELANAEMRTELKDLRAKHGKGIVEQAKELQAVREALGVGEDAEESSTVDKVVGALSSPAALNFAEKVLSGRAAAQPQQPAAPALPRAPKFVTAPDGKRFRLMPSGEMIPLKPKPKVIATTLPDGTPGPTLPVIPAEVSAQVTDYLERAFAGNQDPVIMAQTARTHVPEEIMAVIREHGVDVYLSKVARLPSGSPLATQAGKNWVRKVGEALVE
jgi:hypothetical protein